MGKLYQITEDDLATLERAMPELTVSLSVNTTNRHRVLIRKVKDILSDVRWDYQPHSNIEIISDETENGDQPK